YVSTSSFSSSFIPPLPPCPPLFPYTTLFRSLAQAAAALPEQPYVALVIRTDDPRSLEGAIHSVLDVRRRKVENSPGKEWYLTSPDRKSTRLNSSHVKISYAVFCLKKKKEIAS